MNHLPRKTTTTHEEMTSEQREQRVDELFKAIAFTAEAFDYKKNDISKRIEPMVNELWAITQVQMKNHELDWKHKGEERPILQATINT